jgi:biopolymer transport protein ExbD
MIRGGHSYFQVDKARIEVIPMIDIMMFLLVFFIVITLKMISATGIQLDLPSSQTTQDLKPTKVTIGVQKDGVMAVDGIQLNAAELKAKLESAKQNSKAVEVIIAGDKEVALQKLLDVMDVVRTVGISAVGIAAKPETAPAQ